MKNRYMHNIRSSQLMLLCLSIISMAIFTLALPAQTYRATITGRVIDSTGAVIPGAMVVAREQATGTEYRATTSETGNYAIQQLPVGVYDISVEASGFRRYLQSDVRINVAQTLTRDITLELGATSETIEVTATGLAIESSSSDLGTVISQERVMDLPLSVSGNMRNPESFIFLTPGVTGNTSNTQINGSQSRSKEVLFDGVGSTSPESGGILFSYPSVEAISEFKLVRSTFSAEYGRTGGGFEIFVSRSGTNDLHGSAFDYLRNDAFDSRGFFAKSVGINRQNEFGGRLGGPIFIPKMYDGRNRSFFHVVYSGFRYRKGATNSLSSLPAVKFRDGDFSELVDRDQRQIPIYDPATTRIVDGGYMRDVFPNNQIPAARISSVSRNIVSLLPVPTNSDLLDNFLFTGKGRYDKDQVNVKIDHDFSERNRLSGFVYIGTADDLGAENLPIPFATGRETWRRSRWARLSHDFIVSPSSLNHFNIGFTREGEFWSNLNADQDWPTRIGLAGVTTDKGNSFPLINLSGGYTGWASEAKTVGMQVNNVWQVSDAFSKVYRNHNFKVGVEARWLQTNGADIASNQGQFSFSQFETAMPTQAGRASTGDSFASFLLGEVDSGMVKVFATVPGNRYRYFASYFQDDWKATPKLTINYGLRYDIFFPRRERFNDMSGFDPTLPNPGAGDRLGAIAFLGSGPGRNGRTSFADTDFKNFGPRFGLAYAFDNNTVLRAGYGVYYASGNATTGLRSSQSFSFGFNASPSFSSTDLGVTPAFNWDNGFPQDFPRPPFIDPTVANGSAVNMIGRGDGRPPYFQDWSFGIQRQLPNELLVEAAYVGNKGTRLGTGLMSLNQVDPRYLSLGDLLSQSITSAGARDANIDLPYEGFTGSVAQALRPYPQYQGINNNSNPNGNSTYHSLQVKAEKRMTHGFSYLAAYTWSKVLTDGNIAAGGGPAGMTYYNRRLEKSLSSDYRPQSLSLSLLWDLPFGAGKPFLNQGSVVTKLVGGWTFTAIHRYEAGGPIGVSVRNTLPLFGGQRPDAVAGVNRKASFGKFDPAKDLYLNPAAFGVPEPFTFGDAARYYEDLRSFAFYDESWGLVKRTALTEHVNLTFRAEFFNVLNRVVLGAPASNISDLNYGRVSSQANTPRQGQLALRIDF